MSPKRKKRSATKPTKKAKKTARRSARKPKVARNAVRRPKAKSRTRAKTLATSAKPKATSGKRSHSVARTNGAAPAHRSRKPEEPLLEHAHIEEEESVTIGGYDESEDFEEPYSEEEDEYSDDSDEGF